MKLQQKLRLRQNRRWRVRKKVRGTPDRPRLTVCFSHQHIYAQCIDDTTGRTLVYVSSLDKDRRDAKLSPNQEGAVALGKVMAEKAVAAGITPVVFDRAGRRYHGRVKAFADSAREGGLQF